MANERKSSRELVKDILFFVIILIVGLACVLIKFSSKEENGAGKNVAEMIVAVHVKGEVKNSGYYELKYGSRVKDAIDAAGGATENADTDAVNLAEKLFDGQELIIPPKGEKPKETAQDNSGKININTASKIELTALYGIGDSLAEQIVSYREQNGKFKSINDLKKISGIGASKFEKFKDNITV